MRDYEDTGNHSFRFSSGTTTEAFKHKDHGVEVTSEISNRHEGGVAIEILQRTSDLTGVSMRMSVVEARELAVLLNDILKMNDEANLAQARLDFYSAHETVD